MKTKGDICEAGVAFLNIVQTILSFQIGNLYVLRRLEVRRF
jgi:hypothetical protein